MDIILYNIGFTLLLLIVGYLCGSIPNGIWIGKLFFHKDPRDYGSGNSGGTNVGRVFGKGVGIFVVVLDVLKVMLPIYTAWAILTRVPMYNDLPLVPRIEVKMSGADISQYAIQWPIYWLVGLGAYFGHCYPIFGQFRGGKNVAVFYGVFISCCWVGWICLLIFLVVILIKKIVSLASIISSWVSVLWVWVWAILIATKVITGPATWIVGYGPTVEMNYVYAIVITIGAILLTIKHKTNIERIRNGTENKVKWLKDKTSK